ncbi:histidinol-phosphate transaminase [soil metagenome]
MQQYLRPDIRAMAGYAPGEQPRTDDFVKLNTNENPYPPSPRALEAIQQAVRGERLRKYPDPSGKAFREAAGRMLNVDPEGILVGNGSDDLLTIVTRAFVPQGGCIAAPTPSYVLYPSLAQIQGARFEGVPFTENWGLPDPWPLRGQANLVFLTNPNSPSGTSIDPEQIGAWAEGLDAPLILDEAYVDFAEQNGLGLVESSPVIVLRTLSKSYSLAGLRFGFAIADPSTIAELIKVKDSYNCDALSLAGALAALEDREYMLTTRTRILATRNRLTSLMQRLGFVVSPSQSNFVWCRRQDRPVKPIYEELKARNILVRYMNYAGYGDGLRISVGTEVEIDRLQEELERIL